MLSRLVLTGVRSTPATRTVCLTGATPRIAARFLCTQPSSASLVVHGKPVAPSSEPRFAVFAAAGSQFKVTEGDRVFVDKLKEESGEAVKVGETLVFNEVSCAALC